MATFLFQSDREHKFLVHKKVLLLIILFVFLLSCNVVSAYTYNGEISTIKITSTTIHLGDKIQHSVTVKNTGDVPLPYIVEIWSGGIMRDTNYDSLEVAPGLSRTEVWETTAPDSPGSVTYTYKLYWDKTWPDANAILEVETRSITVVGPPGTLSISSSPSGASVYLDGTYRGVTPINIPGISAGSHAIKLTKSAYDDYSTAVIVNSGSTTSITGILNAHPTTGSIYATSSPSGSSVYLDGMFKGSTPIVLDSLSPRSYSIKISYPNYGDFSSSVNVESGKTTNIYGTLNPILQQGTIYVTSSPSGANVYLDGLYIGTTPLGKDSIKPESHSIRLTIDGYYDYETSTYVNAGKITNIRGTLNPKPVNTPSSSSPINFPEIPGFGYEIALISLVIIGIIVVLKKEY